MSTDVNIQKPRAPFVVVTRKGGFPATTIDEARRLARPLVGDAKAVVTDADGHKFSPRAFIEAADAWDDARAAQAAEKAKAVKNAGEGPGHQSAAPLGSPKDIKHWAAATADIDLDDGPPPGWAPAPKPEVTARSSARMPSPASTRSSASHPVANRRGPSDRRTSDRRPQRGSGSGSQVNTVAIAIAIGVVILVALIFALTRHSAEPIAAPTVLPSTPRPAAQPAPVANPDGTVRPEDRPLPSFMR
jgi:hypothetical protein